MGAAVVLPPELKSHKRTASAVAQILTLMIVSMISVLDATDDIADDPFAVVTFAPKVKSDHQEDPHHLSHTGSYCDVTPHHNWYSKHGKYYILFPHQKCRYPDCQETCAANNATLIMPENQQEFDTLKSFATFYTGDVYIGVNLPIYQDTHIHCNQAECERYLTFANGSVLAA